MSDKGEEHSDQWPNMRMKHLEMLQSTIARMNNHSASIKGYTISVLAGFIGLAIAVKDNSLMAYSLPVFILFSIIDANYLRLERAFIDQYNRVRNSALDQSPDFAISPSTTLSQSWIDAYISWSVSGFYVPIIAILTFFYFLY